MFLIISFKRYFCHAKNRNELFFIRKIIPLMAQSKVESVDDEFNASESGGGGGERAPLPVGITV